VGSLAKFEENVDPFLRAHPGPRKRVRGVCFFEGVKNANSSLHYFYFSGRLEIQYFGGGDFEKSQGIEPAANPCYNRIATELLLCCRLS